MWDIIAIVTLLQKCQFSQLAHDRSVVALFVHYCQQSQEICSFQCHLFLQVQFPNCDSLISHPPSGRQITTHRKNQLLLSFSHFQMIWNMKNVWLIIIDQISIWLTRQPLWSVLRENVNMKYYNRTPKWRTTNRMPLRISATK